VRSPVLNLALCALVVTRVAFGADFPPPEVQIRKAFDELVADVAASFDVLEGDNCARYELVDRRLRGQFGIANSSRMILGKYWPEIPGEQQRFVETFYRFLVATYGDLVIEFNADTLQVLPRDETPEVYDAWVETNIRMNDDEIVPVGLRVRFVEDAWRIVDVKPETFSYAREFRDTFWSSIHDVGFDGLIDWLEKETAQRTLCGQWRPKLTGG